VIPTRIEEKNAMNRRAFAVWTVIAGLLIGTLGTFFFYRKTIGLSLPLFALVVIGALFFFTRAADRRVNLRNAWTLIALLFFAVMVAVRADLGLAALNVMAILALGALTLHYLLVRNPLDEDTFGDYLRHAMVSSIMIGLTPIYQAVQSLAWVREQRPLKGAHTKSVVRGLVFTIPLLFVFVVLLASADAVFEDYLNRFWNLFQIQNLEALFDQGFLIFVLGWLGCGALAYGIARHLPADTETETEPAPKASATHIETDEIDENADELEPIFSHNMPPGAPAPALAMAASGTAVRAQPSTRTANGVAARPKPAKKHPFTLGMIEAVMMIGAVDLLFGVFVLIQFAYFFGGQANISFEGYTYAQYARRGFFELIAVSVLTLGLVLWLDWVTVRHNPRQHTLFRALSVVVVALIGVMLLSASQRMSLYEEAYGFTHLRVYTHVFMFWLAVLFGVFLLSLFRLRERVFSVGLLAVIIGYVVTLNVMNVENTITERNVSRYLNAAGQHEIDICYLRTMSVDALQAMMALYNAPETSDEVRGHVEWWMATQLYQLDRMDTSIFSYNTARAQARAALEPLHDELPDLLNGSSNGADSFRYCYEYSD
jgi:hypothetical protein